MDYLREGINLRAFAQKDPLVEYKKETFNMFESLRMAVAMEATEKFFKIQFSPSSEFEKPTRDSEQLIYNERESESFAFAAHSREASPSQREKPLNRRQRRQQSQLFKKQRIKI